MNAGKIKRFFQNNSEKQRGGTILVFLICLGLSAFFWLLNSLEKRYTDRISVPVKYINLPKDKQLVGSLPKKLDLIVDGYGYTLLNHKLRLAFSPVLISVNDLTDNILENQNFSRYTIHTSAHKEEIEKQISSEIKIINIKPDTITFNFSYVIERKMKVEPNIGLTFGKNFILRATPYTQPDSVIVRGPVNIMDTMRAVRTRYETIKEVTHNIEKSVLLEQIEGLSYSEKKVALYIDIEQNTEAVFSVPVEVINVPDSINIKTFPGKVKVYCKVGLSSYKKLTENSFKVVADYRKIDRQANKVKVLLTQYPDILLSVDFSPQEVEYIIEKQSR